MLTISVTACFLSVFLYLSVTLSFCHSLSPLLVPQTRLRLPCPTLQLPATAHITRNYYSAWQSVPYARPRPRRPAAVAAAAARPTPSAAAQTAAVAVP